MSDIPDRLWVVISEEGTPEFESIWPELCHEHINEAIADGNPDAGRWLVREYALVKS